MNWNLLHFILNYHNQSENNSLIHLIPKWLRMYEIWIIVRYCILNLKFVKLCSGNVIVNKRFLFDVIKV